MTKEEKKIEYYDSKSVVKMLMTLIELDVFKNEKSYPKFSEEEVEFLIKLIFEKPNELVYIYLADYISTNYFDGRFFLSGSFMKKLRFFYKFLEYNGNATKAAIAVGYSKKCAKQQACRLMRELRGYKK